MNADALGDGAAWAAWLRPVLLARRRLALVLPCLCAMQLLLANAARREGAHAVSVQVAGDVALDKALRAAHFVMRDQRPFFAILGETVRDKGVTLRWYITQADEDI